jgi:hypothetical protein
MKMIRRKRRDENRNVQDAGAGRGDAGLKGTTKL